MEVLCMEDKQEQVKAIIFDVDGVLTESKHPMDRPLGTYLSKLAEKYKIALITGGRYEQIVNQVIDYLPDGRMNRQSSQFYLIPTSGAEMFEFEYFDEYGDADWHQVYQEKMEHKEWDEIIAAMQELIDLHPQWFPQCHYQDKRIEVRRGVQITLSALGQHASLVDKKGWDEYTHRRRYLVSVLEKMLPEHEIRYGGLTSIDVTKKGVNKGYGVDRFLEHLNLEPKDAVFIGNELESGGNDYPVLHTGVRCIPVKYWEETYQLVQQWLAKGKI